MCGTEDACLQMLISSDLPKDCNWMRLTVALRVIGEESLADKMEKLHVQPCESKCNYVINPLCMREGYSSCSVYVCLCVCYHANCYRYTLAAIYLICLFVCFFVEVQHYAFCAVSTYSLCGFH